MSRERLQKILRDFDFDSHRFDDGAEDVALDALEAELHKTHLRGQIEALEWVLSYTGAPPRGDTRIRVSEIKEDLASLDRAGSEREG